MTQLLTARTDKAETINEIAKLLDRHVMVGLTPSDQALVRQHIAWLRAQDGVLQVNCKLETYPPANTRITLELGFGALAPVKRQDA